MTIRVAVVGTGYWGRNHVRTLAALRDQGTDLELIVCDIDLARATELANEHQATPSTDVNTLVSELNVDAATIATPSPLHAQQAIQLIKKGVSVLVEKPLALTVDEAENVFQTATSNSTLLSVGHVFRHHAGVKEARNMIADGNLGPVRLLESIRTAVRDPRPDMGAIHALGIHDYDVFSYLMGDNPPSNLISRATPSTIEGIEDHAVTLLSFPQPTGLEGPHALCQSTVGWRGRIGGKQRSLRIIGRDKSIDVDYLDHSGIWIHHHPNEEVGGEFGGPGAARRERINLPLGEPALTAELRHFIGLVSCNATQDPITGGEVGISGVKMVEMALQSLN